MKYRSIFTFVIPIYALSSIVVASNLFVYAQTNESSQGVPSSQTPAENQLLKIRCSNGLLVDRASECPSSDECPSPNPAGNDTLQCSPSSVSSGVSNNGTSVNNETGNIGGSSKNEVGNTGQVQVLTIETDKKLYEPGEVVNFIVKNLGSEPITFSNSALGLNIQNEQTHEKYPIFSAQVITTLDSGGQKSLNWDQKNPSGQNVKEGNYKASVSNGTLEGNVAFSIVK